MPKREKRYVAVKTVKAITKPDVAATEANVVNEVPLEVVDSAANQYNVPVDQWNKWDKSQRSRFNEVYSAMPLSPSLFTHKDAVTIPAEQWTTIAWNAAWVAAGA